MSQKYYYRVWINQQTKLKELVKNDKDMVERGPYNNVDKIKKALAETYVSYSTIIIKLEEVDDQLIRPDLQDIIRQTFATTLARLLQVKHEMSRLGDDWCDYMYNSLIEKNLTPFDIQLKMPHGFAAHCVKNQEKIRLLLESIREKIKMADASKTAMSKEDNEPEETPTILFDAKERLQKGNMIIEARRSVDASSLFSFADGISLAGENVKVMRAGSLKRLSNEEEEFGQHEDELMDKQSAMTDFDTSKWMNILNTGNVNQDIIEEDEKYKIFNRSERNEQKIAYDALVEAMKSKWKNLKGPIMEGDLEQALRDWFLELYLNTNEFPLYPSDDKVQMINGSVNSTSKHSKKQLTGKLPFLPLYGGSVLIPLQYWIPPGEYAQRASEESKKDTKKRTNMKQTKTKKVIDTFEFSLLPSNCLSILDDLLSGGESNWKTETEVPASETVANQAFHELQLEIMEGLDENLRNELEDLRKITNKNKSSKKKKTEKIFKKSVKQITGDNLHETLEELVRMNILKENRDAKINNYSEECNLEGKKQILDDLLQWCILPLSHSEIHYLAPLVRSICLVGPEHVGKKSLFNIVASETGSAIFDISPQIMSNLELNPKDLKNLIVKIMEMAKELQPSVVFINNVEQLFYKKVPKEERSWKRGPLKKLIKELVRKITREDRILVVGKSNQPWLSNQRQMKQVFDKFIYIPHPSYNTYLSIWRQTFLANQRHLIEAPFAKTSEKAGWKVKFIKETVYNTTRNQHFTLDSTEMIKMLFQLHKDVKIIGKDQFQNFLTKLQ